MAETKALSHVHGIRDCGIDEAPDGAADAVDWHTLVESIREDASSHDIARRILQIGRTMTTGAAHMFLLGEYLLEQKREIPYGEFGRWIEGQGLAQRTARKYMAFARRTARWTHDNGQLVPFRTLTALVHGDIPEPFVVPLGEGEDGPSLNGALEAPIRHQEMDDDTSGDPKELSVKAESAAGEPAQRNDELEDPDSPEEAEEDLAVPDEQAYARARDLMSVMEQFADVVESLGEAAVCGMDSAQTRKLGEAMNRVDETLAVVKALAARRTRLLNRAGMQEAS